MTDDRVDWTEEQWEEWESSMVEELVEMGEIEPSWFNGTTNEEGEVYGG